ncbi:MAG: AAA family ATPase [Pirellulales bacterium]|nr:AAA family ATPase [Pirellulales bacterium]
MPALFERERPTTLDGVVGQPLTVKRLTALKERGWGGRAYWISGLSGTGKTTIAKIIASDVASEFATTETSVSRFTPKALKDWEDSLCCRCIDGKGHALIVNEAHGLRNATITDFLDVLERLPEYAVVIFTTTNEGQEALFEDCMDTAPLLSRCIRLELLSNGKELELAFALEARRIAQKHGLDGKPIGAYVELVRQCKHNMRAVLQAIDSGCMAD